MDTFNIELIGIQQEWSLDILLNESNRLNNTIKSIDESIIQEGIGDVLKTLKDKVVKFFRWLWRKIRDFFHNIRDAIKQKMNKEIIPRFDEYADFFYKDYKGEEIIFGEFMNDFSEVKIMFAANLQKGMQNVEKLNNSIIDDIQRTKDLGGEETTSEFVDTYYKDRIEQEFMKAVLDVRYHYINRDQNDEDVKKQIIDAYTYKYSSPISKNRNKVFKFSIDPSKPEEFKEQYKNLKLAISMDELKAIEKMQSDFEKKIKGFEKTATDLCNKLDNSKILEVYLGCTAKSSQLMMNAVQGYRGLSDIINADIMKAFNKMKEEYKRLS